MMARPRSKLDRLNQHELVTARLKTEPSGIYRERLLAINHGLANDKTLDEIAQLAGRSRATIQTWFDRYREGGVDGLCSRSKVKVGRKHGLQGNAEKELRKKLAKGSFRTAEQARDWLCQQFGIERSTATVRRWMGKFGARLKVVRPRHPQSCEQKRFEFRHQMARQVFETLKENTLDFRDRPLRLWVADEARFGLQPSHRRAWVTQGVRAHKNSRCRYDWQYIWAALQIGGGGSEFLYTNKADQDLSGKFLEQISVRDPYAIHVVIWDGAGFHPKNGDERIPDNVVVLRQPPYSPELNPVERLWDQLRDALCNRSWRDLDELMEAATRWLRQFWEKPERILSLVGNGWMRQQANG